MSGLIALSNGKAFERKVRIPKAAGKYFSQHRFYTDFLKPRGVNYRDHVSLRLVPDEAIYVKKSNTMYIIEVKFQSSSGSIDEKLQTCDFKKKQYEKILKELGIKVRYAYLLNDWFKHKRYTDVIEYIESVGCHVFFNKIPQKFFI